MTAPTRTDEVAIEDRLVESAVAALEMLSIYLGRTLGLYDHLSEQVTVERFSELSGVHPRYSREWLEQQAVAGLIDVTNVDLPADLREYCVSDRHRDSFIDPDSPSQVGPLADMVVGVAGVIDKVAEVYRTGGGVSFAEYGPAMRHGQAGINRPAFKHDLVGSWIGESVPEIAARLAEGGSIADLGCGAGWSSIALAAGFPAAAVVGFDTDEASIEDALVNARDCGVSPQFVYSSGESLGAHGPFELITILEALHDMDDPVAVLEKAREALAPGGAVVIADEKVADEFTAPGDVLERMMYGWSVTHCLPAAMTEEDSAGLGTVLRQGLVRQLALSAGFTSVETPEIDAGFFRIYVLRP